MFYCDERREDAVIKDDVMFVYIAFTGDVVGGWQMALIV